MKTIKPFKAIQGIFLMANRKPAIKKANDPPAEHHELDSTNPKLKSIGGSNFDDWNNILANQAMDTGWYGNNSNPNQTHKRHSAYLCFLSSVEPKDELEGMLAAQLNVHYRRACKPDCTAASGAKRPFIRKQHRVTDKGIVESLSVWNQARGGRA